MSENDCLFCRMARGEIEVEKAFENDDVFAINDINPRAPVHLLVIPKQHLDSARDLGEQSGDLLAQMLTAANKVAEVRRISASGFRLTFNVGDEGGQTIPHLHLHVLGGRRLGSEG